MLIVISSPAPVADEASIINKLFEEGLEILHLRKPGAPAGELASLIEAINCHYYSRIALHHHHNIATNYGITRLHFTEAKRKQVTEENLRRLRTAKIFLSTSIHSIVEYNALSSSFDYCFFGPVFNSISRKDYNSSLQENFIFPVKRDHPKAIAIGGISEKNINHALKMQFNGVAVLGTIWQKPGESIQQYKFLQQAWKQTDGLY